LGVWAGLGEGIEERARWHVQVFRTPAIVASMPLDAPGRGAPPLTGYFARVIGQVSGVGVGPRGPLEGILRSSFQFVPYDAAPNQHVASQSVCRLGQPRRPRPT